MFSFSSPVATRKKDRKDLEVERTEDLTERDCNAQARAGSPDRVAATGFQAHAPRSASLKMRAVGLMWWAMGLGPASAPWLPDLLSMSESRFRCKNREPSLTPLVRMVSTLGLLQACLGTTSESTEALKHAEEAEALQILRAAHCSLKTVLTL